jgi:phenylacetate-CoA ligase
MKIDSFLFRLPILLQNIVISLYGYKLKRNRYSGQYPLLKQKAYERLQYSKEKIEQYQAETLRQIIKNAYDNVPYYNKIFKANGLLPQDIQDASDLKKIPLLEKNEIRSDPESLVNSTYSRKSLEVIHTTGSTGTPLNIYCNHAVRQKNYAFYDRFLENGGISKRGNRATFGGRIIVPANQKSPPFWRNSVLQKNMLFSSYHLTEKNIPFYIEALKRYAPDIIDTYPSSLYVIAEYALRHGVDLKNVTKGITTSAETFSDEQRRVITEAFGVPVLDQYGAAEMCVFVGQCVQGSYHIHTDYGIVEFLKADGTSGKPGEECELVCTGFINPVMPLIRYRIGDIGILSDRKCACGLPFPVMEKLVGRTDDCIVTPDGRIIGRLSPVLKGFPIKEAQYIQVVKEILVVLIVKDYDFTNQTEGQCFKAIRERVGDSIKIEFKYVESIERGVGGKLRSVISRVARPS